MGDGPDELTDGSAHLGEAGGERLRVELGGAGHVADGVIPPGEQHHVEELRRVELGDEA